MSNPYNRSYPSLYRGIVESNEDPENLGRCRVRVPSVHGELTYPVDILPWARPIALSPIKSGRGSVNIPDKGDIVWVFFEGSVRDCPVYFGGTYAKGDIAINTGVVDIYVEGADRISYNRDGRSLNMTIGDSGVEISPSSLNLSSNESVTVSSKSVDISSADSVKISSDSIDISGGESINLSGDSLDIEGNTVKISADSVDIIGDLTVKGSIHIVGDIEVTGDMDVSGTTKLNDVVIGGSITGGGFHE